MKFLRNDVSIIVPEYDSDLPIDLADPLSQGSAVDIRSLHGKRFTHKDYEYEIRYEGGIGCFVGLYRREIGRRNFRYYAGEGCYKCPDAAAAFESLRELLP